jgi:UDP-N-acetyl-2-amino-2-deoxyglucuronate dehydrogenase
LYLFGEKGTVKAGGASVNKIEEWHFSDMLDDPEQVKAQFAETPRMSMDLVIRLFMQMSLTR